MTNPITPLRATVRALASWALCLLVVIAWTAVELPT
jgi:hypothetical protein